MLLIEAVEVKVPEWGGGTVRYSDRARDFMRCHQRLNKRPLALHSSTQY